MKTSRKARSAIVPEPTALQVESWRLLWDEFERDGPALSEYREWQDHRQRAQPQMLELLGRFISGAVDVEEFRAIFHQRTRTSWDLFGLCGASVGSPGVIE